jgi:hypothetical protein
MAKLPKKGREVGDRRRPEEALPERGNNASRNRDVEMFKKGVS